MAGRVLRSSMSPASFVSGLVVGVVLLGGVGVLAFMGVESLALVFAQIVVALGLARFALNGLHGEWSGTVFSSAGGELPEVGAATLRFLALSAVLSIPALYLSPAGGLLPALLTPAADARYAALVTLAVAGVLAPPALLVMAVSADGFGELLSPLAWRARFGGRLLDLFALYVVYTGGLVLATLLSLPVVAIAFAVGPRLGAVVAGAVGCLTFGMTINLTGRLCGFFACGELGIWDGVPSARHDDASAAAAPAREPLEAQPDLELDAGPVATDDEPDRRDAEATRVIGAPAPADEATRVVAVPVPSDDADEATRVVAVHAPSDSAEATRAVAVPAAADDHAATRVAAAPVDTDTTRLVMPTTPDSKIGDRPAADTCPDPGATRVVARPAHDEPPRPVRRVPSNDPWPAPPPPAERRPPLLDGAQRVEAAMRRFALEPATAVGMLQELDAGFAPDPHVLAALGCCHYGAGRVDRGLELANRAIGLILEQGRIRIAVDIFKTMRPHLDRLDLGQDALLLVAGEMARTDDLAGAAKAYSAVIGRDPGEARAIKGLLQVAERLVDESERPDAAVKVYRYLLEHCAGSPLVEFMREGLAAAERALASREDPVAT